MSNKKLTETPTTINAANIAGSALEGIIQIQDPAILEDVVGGNGPPSAPPPPPPPPRPPTTYPGQPPIPNSPAWGPYPASVNSD